MKNFEYKIEKEIIHPNVDKICLAKSRPVINAITEDRGNYRLNTSRVENKLAKAVSEALKELNLDDSEENYKNISEQIIKFSIEAIAREQAMGKISSFESLEEKYLEILADRIVKLNNQGVELQDYSEIISLINKLDNNKILDNDNRSKLIEDLSSKLLFKSKN
ncbi:MAG TPA: hypothetical protein PK142_01810 [bacterium]|nr:hypothetical protein [bacterium]